MNFVMSTFKVELELVKNLLLRREDYLLQRETPAASFADDYVHFSQKWIINRHFKVLDSCSYRGRKVIEDERERQRERKRRVR